MEICFSGVTMPNGQKKYITAAFPSCCGKTNLAMLQPKLPGYKVGAHNLGFLPGKYCLKISSMIYLSIIGEIFITIEIILYLILRDRNGSNIINC